MMRFMINLMIIFGIVVVLYLIVGTMLCFTRGFTWFLILTVLSLSFIVGICVFDACSDEQFVEDSIETSSIQLSEVKFSDDYRSVSVFYSENDSLKILPIDLKDCTIKKGTQAELTIEKHKYNTQKIWGEFYLPIFNKEFTKVTYTLIVV